MTRKDYVKIAEALNSARPPHKKSDPNDTREAWETWAMTVDKITDVLAADNDDFDRTRFLRACGAEG
jgi:hypothetical protein